MSMTALSHDTASNPLDIMEQIVTANDWAFDRRSDSEMAVEAPGRWCDYGLYFCWSHEISAMHFTCAFDLKVPEKRRSGVDELLALAEGAAVSLVREPGRYGRYRNPRMRTVLPGVPVRVAGRQAAAGRAGGGDARVH